MTLTWQTFWGGQLAPIITILLCAALAAWLVRWAGRTDEDSPPNRTFPSGSPSDMEPGGQSQDGERRAD